jgi:hypothetical protein
MASGWIWKAINNHLPLPIYIIWFSTKHLSEVGLMTMLIILFGLSATAFPYT